MNLKNTYLTLFLALIIFVSKGQEVTLNEYLFPINPGQQNYLAGTVGEIRHAHFHTGIDVKTGGRTGLPVLATQSGYVSRIKVSPSGYGNTIYIQHPNGCYSVYAHLAAFNPQLDEWITEQQYEKEAFIVDLFPKKNQFTFSQGDVIGFSGNSGSSSGPHLHFEIRDPKNNPIDILAFGFDEIKDHIPPAIKKIAFVTLDEGARINGFFGRHEFGLTKKGSIYSTTVPIHLSGRIGIEIYCYDPMDNINNKNGVIKTELKIDGELKFGEHKHSLSFARQRNTLVHYNYEATRKGSSKFNKLYLSDGNELRFYQETNKGIIFDNQKEIEIISYDSHGNKSTARLRLSDKPVISKPWVPELDQVGNFLHLRSSQTLSIKLTEWETLKPYHTSGEDQYFIWDMRKGTPKAIFINGKTVETGFSATLPSNQKINYIQKEFDLELSNRSLFDTLYLAFEKSYDSARSLELFEFKNKIEPIRSNIKFQLKPDLPYSNDAKVYSVFGNRFNYIGGEWNGSNISFSSRDFATYTILEDSIPPKVIPRVINTNDLKFRISDNLSGIQSFKAWLNGTFVLMHYEPKRNLIWSKKLKKNIPFEGEFILEVIDNANNKTTYTRKL